MRSDNLMWIHAMNHTHTHPVMYSGNDITAEQSVYDTMHGKLYGRCEQKCSWVQSSGVSTQETLTGKNLFDISSIIVTNIYGTSQITENGITKTDTVDATAQRIQFVIDIGKFVQGSTYHLSFDSDFMPTGIKVGEASTISDTGSFSKYGSSTFTITEITKPYLIVLIYAAHYPIGIPYSISNIQIESGSSSTSYEPYCGGIHSPNPNYPQEIVPFLSAGTYKVPCLLSQCGFYEVVIPNDLHGIGEYKDTVEIEQYGGTGKITKNTAKIDSYNGETISMQYLSTTGELSTGATVVYQLSTPTVTPFTSTWVLTSTSPDLPAEAMTVITPSPDYQSPIWCADGKVTSTGNAQCTRPPTTYQLQPDFGAIQVPTTDPYCNYIDSDGVGWCADELDLATGGGMRRVMKYVFDGTENWTIGLYPVSNTTQFYIKKPANMSVEISRTYNTHFVNRRIINGTLIGSGYNMYPSLSTGITTVELWKYFLTAQYAARTPVTVWYVLQTPIQFHVDPPALKTYPRYTRVYADGTVKPWMRLTVKTY